jgi:hypothetical protein
MKKIFLALICLAATTLTKSQAIPSAEKGVNYGKPFTLDSALSEAQIKEKMNATQFSGQIKGKVVEVCQTMGCWIKIAIPTGDTVLAKTNDEFFMPKNIVGKTVMVNGDASVKERPVKELQHYAKDAGQSKEEIAKITKPKKELTIKLKGVKVLE